MSGTTVPRIRTVEVFRHDRPHETDEAVRLLTDAAREAGVELVFDADGPVRADICLVLGGDGATLRALRKHAGTGVPVFAINEISFQRRPEINIAHLSYSLAGDWVARVPCDGLIAATPAGSTAYSLSVGGPIVAWGVKGFVVNVIAPHALSSRALVAAPEDVLRVVNDGADPVDVVIDGIRTGEFAAGQDCEIKFTPDVVGLAQLPDSSFYRRFREKLLQLTS